MHYGRESGIDIKTAGRIYPKATALGCIDRPNISEILTLLESTSISEAAVGEARRYVME
jgi:hypothetical protein